MHHFCTPSNSSISTSRTQITQPQHVLSARSCRYLSVGRSPCQRRTKTRAQQQQQSFAAGVQSAKQYDLIGLSNLCVDVVVNVDALPGSDEKSRLQLLHKLTASPPSEQHWEVGGNCNCLIAAARLGMTVGSIGHVGNDVYGRYMDSIMQQEGIHSVMRIMPAEARGTKLDETLLCFVLVDPQGKHSFVSAYDFGPWPLLEGVTELPVSVMQALQSTSAVFTNGFVFDELPLDLVKTAIQAASEAGAAVCFDPGPRAFTMQTGSRRHALDTVLDLSHVVLMTEEEAAQVTGLTDPQAAAEAVLNRPNTSTEWCVVKMGGAGSVLVTKAGEVRHAPAFKVDVKDTVGCGDSFAAAIAMGFCRTHDVGATLLLANAVGAATATGRGAGTNVAKADTVMDLLQGAASSSSSSINSSSSTRVITPCAADLETAIDVLRCSLSTVEDWPEQLQPSTNGNGNGSTNGGRASSAARQGRAPAARAA